MVFDVSTLGYIQNTQSIILDYDIEIKELNKDDQIFVAGALGNFSLAGFEMVNWHKEIKVSQSTYFIIIEFIQARYVLHHHVLSTIRTVCPRVMDILPDSS